MKKVGDRIGAVLSSKNDVVKFLGYGTYQGDHVPPPEVKMWGEPLTHPNPKLVLDNGDEVYGCECWWGSEAAVVKHLVGKTVETVSIKTARGT